MEVYTYTLKVISDLPCGTSETAGESNPASKTASVDANTSKSDRFFQQYISHIWTVKGKM